MAKKRAAEQAESVKEPVQEQGPPQWRNRIVGHADVPPGELIANDKNWRLHPAAQTGVLNDIIDEIGFLRSVTVNKTTGRVIDGHLRLKIGLKRGEPSIPVEFVELSEEEEAIALATMDPITMMANADQAALAALVADVSINSESVQKMLESMIDTGLPIALPEPEPEERPEKKALAIPGIRYEIVVECRDEAEQKSYFEQFEAEGKKCRVLTF